MQCLRSSPRPCPWHSAPLPDRDAIQTSIPCSGASGSGVPLALASANMNALIAAIPQTRGQSNVNHSRSRLPERAFDNAGLHVVGIQEARVRGSQTVDGLCYTMYVSGSTEQGHYGTQIWIHRRLGHKLESATSHSPRLMEVRIRLTSSNITLITFAAHVPHVGPSGDTSAATAYWETLSAALSRALARAHDAYVVILADANARVGSVRALEIGPCEPEIENLAGELFRQFLASHAMYAANTLCDAGHTWTGTRGHVSRIDYVMLSEGLYHVMSGSRVADEIDLSTAVRDDHRVITAKVDLTRVTGLPLMARQVTARFEIDNGRVNDPFAAEAFQYMISWFRPQPGATVDGQTRSMVAHTKASALAVFGLPKKRPRNCWITEETWRHVQVSAPLRKLRLTVARLIKAAHIRRGFYAWCSALAYRHRSWGPCDPSSPVGATSWLALLWGRRNRQSLRLARLVDACAVSCVYHNQLSVRITAARDRNEYLHTQAYRAARAAAAGDHKTCHVIVGMLAGSPKKPLKAVFMKDGSLSSSEHERQLRWQEHFVEVFRGDICASIDEMQRSAVYPLPDGEHSFHVSVADTFAAIMSLGTNRAPGPDELTAPILKPGGCVLPNHVNAIQRRGVSEESWPTDWKGGRLVDGWKRKGDARQCPLSRGLLISDHLSKAFAAVTKGECAQAVDRPIPPDQYRIAIMTTINRTAMTTINRIAITTISRIAIITTINRIAISAEAGPEVVRILLLTA